MKGGGTCLCKSASQSIFYRVREDDWDTSSLRLKLWHYSTESLKGHGNETKYEMWRKIQMFSQSAILLWEYEMASWGKQLFCEKMLMFCKRTQSSLEEHKSFASIEIFSCKGVMFYWETFAFTCKSTDLKCFFYFPPHIISIFPRVLQLNKYFAREHKWRFSIAWYDSVRLTFFFFFSGYIQGRVILLGNIGCKPRAPNTRGAPGKILLFHIIRNRPVLKASEKSSIWKIYGMQFVPFLQAYAIWPPRPVLLKLWTPVHIRTRREFNPDPPPFRISRALIIFPTLINTC